MSVAVENCGDGISAQRIFEPAGAKKRKNFRRLSNDGVNDRRIMEQRNSLGGSQARESGFEFERLFHSFMHEAFDGGFTPGLQRSLPEAAGEAFDTGKTKPVYFAGLPIQDTYAGIRKNGRYFGRFAGFEIVIAQYSNDRNFQRCYVTGQDFGFLLQTAVAEVAP